MDRPASLRTASRRIPVGADRRGIAWDLVRELLPPEAVLTNPCPRCGGPHGPVRITAAPWVASVSYAGATAVVAVAETTAAAAIGVDAEPAVAPHRDALGLDAVLRPGATIRDWTRVEAALKADGTGLRIDPRAVHVTPDGAGWRAVVPGAPALVGWDDGGHPGLVVGVALRPAPG